ncbi:MAG TPA: amidohydrolase family protein [Blastocatellia bacterium]|nr:amidohydrolase family protein [Blastocatellia bacterium]
MKSSRLGRFAAALLSVALTSLIALAGATSGTVRNHNSEPQGQAVLETGKFRLHKFEQPIGEEVYEVSRDGDSLVTHSSFAFTDRGTRVPLEATLRTRQDLSPERFEIKGQTSRLSQIDTTIEITGRKASIREQNKNREAETGDRFFTIAGYAPAAIQMQMVRYWQSHGGSGSLSTLPGGQVGIEFRGRDKIQAEGKPVELDRYIVTGVIWGRESLWFDSNKQLIAEVALDAEFDHFEAIREGYESALSSFVSKAAEDGMAVLAEMARRISPARKGALAIVGATLVDGTGRPPINDSVIVIENDRIISAGPRKSVKVPAGARVIDAKGKTVLPGLWEMHAHFEQVEWGPIYLAAGVTTCRDVGNEFEFITSVRDAIQAGRGLGPRMLLAGIVDGDGPSALGVIRANTPEQAREVVNRYKKAGFAQIKIYSSVKPEILRAICEEAHRLGMTVTGHIPQGMNAIQGVEAGMDQINHIQYIPPVMLPKERKPGVPATVDLESTEAKQSIAFFKEHGTVLDPTMALMEILTHSSADPVSSFEPGIQKVAPELSTQLQNTGVPAGAAARAKATFDQWMNVLAALHKAGVPIITGTDQAVPGHSLHREIELYVKAGFTPMEAIQASTIVPARVMKLDKETGTVEAGKRADLIILDANPLQSISNIRTARFVVAAGKLYNCAELWKSVGFTP